MRALASRPPIEAFRWRFRARSAPRHSGEAVGKLIRRRGVATLVVLLATFAAGSVEGQRSAAIGYTGPTLDRSHWAVVAVRRLEAQGLLVDHLPAQAALPLEVVERALSNASLSDSGRVSGTSALAAEWHARLVEEFGGLRRTRPWGDRDQLRIQPGSGILGAAVALEVGHRSGGAAAGLSQFPPDRTGALPLPDRTFAGVSPDLSLTLGSHLGLRIAGAFQNEQSRLENLELSASWGGWRASAGRIPIAYGHGFGGGVILGGDVALDAVQIGTRRPFRFPGWFERLGPVSFHAFGGGTWWDDRHPDQPFTWGASGRLRPHPRLSIGVNRAAFFGGDRENQPITLKRIVDMLVGRVAGWGFENQIVSVSATFNLPTESLLPLEAYLEWGAEDAAGAWFDIPGRVLGLWTPALPFAPGVAAGLEFSHFGTSCCEGPSWYRHWSFPGSWAARDHALGHPLGGDGREALVHVAADFPGGGLRVSGRSFVRERRSENLFVPGREGRSMGGSGRLDLLPRSNLRLGVAASLEAGSGWSEENLRLEGVIQF